MLKCKSNKKTITFGDKYTFRDKYTMIEKSKTIYLC
jgi:hypothetical protein